MRKPFMAGNWKMNLLTGESRKLASQLKADLGNVKDIEMAVFPTLASVSVVLEALRGSAIAVGVQNCHWEKSGAFTGELSPEMIRDLGCTKVLIGHSERRQYFGETDETVNKKLHAALRAGLEPIVCIGETLAERESGKTLEVVSRQLKGALKDITAAGMKNVTLAYEPVWAIGTGKNATSDQAQEVHASLRSLLQELLGVDVSQQTRIQYGGSVKASNVKELMGMPDIDGALVGGASLIAESFCGIVRYQK
jgi:triosephosphate isomerase (TIM)